MASSRFADGSQPTVTSRAWHLAVTEAPDGSLSVDGLPEDRIERLSLAMRLRDLLTATTHTDDIAGEGDGALWRRYAYRQWQAVYAARTTVDYVEADSGGP
jgi:hypothetical protein